MTLVRAEYVDGAGTPLDGRVCFSPVITAAHGGQVVADAVVCADVEQGQMGPVDMFPSEGHWSTDPGMAWLVQERIAGATPRHYYIWVPEDGELDLAYAQPMLDLSIIPVPSPGPPGPAGATTLDGLDDVDVHLAATGMSLIKQIDGTWKGQNIRVALNQLTDVTAPAATPPNSLLGTVGEGATPGAAEWEPLHLDYIQSVVLGPLPSTVADLGQRVTELEHTGEIVPPDLNLTVDLYGGSFIRIIGADQVPASPDPPYWERDMAFSMILFIRSLRARSSLRGSH
jgi:hypothetical protein